MMIYKLNTAYYPDIKLSKKHTFTNKQIDIIISLSPSLPPSITRSRFTPLTLARPQNLRKLTPAFVALACRRRRRRRRRQHRRTESVGLRGLHSLQQRPHCAPSTPAVCCSLNCRSLRGCSCAFCSTVCRPVLCLHTSFRQTLPLVHTFAPRRCQRRLLSRRRRHQAGPG